MTAREISMFDEMFNMIFKAVSEQKTVPQQAPQRDPLADLRIADNAGMSDLLGKLRRRSRHLKWTSELDEQLDHKKEAIDLCETDHELLHWSLREVFGTSNSTSTVPQQQERDEQQKSNIPTTHLPPEIYPHLLAHLMRTFHDKYRDPHLALAMFEYARRLSIPSYVFGCSTPAYNELIHIRWSSFRDLRGVHDALDEMLINGVELDARTRKLVEGIRRQIGERNLWEDEQRTLLGSDEDVFSLLAKVEALVAKSSFHTRREAGRAPTAALAWNAWKSTAAQEHSEDEWRFGEWDLENMQSS